MSNSLNKINQAMPVLNSIRNAANKFCMRQISLAYLRLAIISSLMLVGAGTVSAQTVTAVQDTTCVAQRVGNITCTAGEFTVASTFSTARASIRPAR